MANLTRTDRKGNRARAGCVLFPLLGLVVLGAMGCLGCKSSSPASKEPGIGTRSSQVQGILHLESFVVNLADTENNRFLRVDIDLGLENPLPGKEGNGGEGEIPTARIRDSILAVLSTWHSDALLAPEGKQKLKDQLLHALRERVPELGVKEVYFTDFLVQR